ncbi:MAG: SAM-dependent methyltransferase [Chloroflexota bacterium]
MIVIVGAGSLVAHLPLSGHASRLLLVVAAIVMLSVEHVTAPALFWPITGDAWRSRFHYEQPIDFFYPILGGEWNVYSCNLWPEGVDTDTEVQVSKLDLLAGLMDLKPGMRVLDVGCGWGGPLVYLCKTYGVEGTGITVSPWQRHASEERVVSQRVNVEILETHWRDFSDTRGYDVIFSDEVIVHFNDLGRFFRHAYGLLKEGGRMVHKELHFTHRDYSRMTRALSHVNQIFASTGNYRTLADELRLVGEAGFEVRHIHQIPLMNYRRSVDRWLANMWHHREQLQALVGPEVFNRYRIYFRIVRRIFTGHTMTLDVVVSHKASRLHSHLVAVSESSMQGV